MATRWTSRGGYTAIIPVVLSLGKTCLNLAMAWLPAVSRLLAQSVQIAADARVDTQPATVTVMDTPPRANE